MANKDYYTFMRITAPDSSPASLKAFARKVNDALEALAMKVYGNLEYNDLHSSVQKTINQKVGTDVLNTFITQNGEQIALLATKKEVHDSLASYDQQLSALADTVDGKSDTWFQDNEPLTAQVRDTWFQGSTKKVWKKIADGTGMDKWSDVTTTALAAALAAAASAADIADRKIQTFYQPNAPTGGTYGVGDLWFDTDDKNKLYRWSGTAWVSAQDTHLDATMTTMQTEFIQAANQIRIAAGQATTNNLGEALETLNSEIIATPSRITAEVTNKTVHVGSTPPSGAELYVGKLWQDTLTDEQLRWKGIVANNARSYPASLSGASVSFNDLSDDHTLGVTVRTVAIQAGSGTPSPANIRPISGKSSIAVRRRGKNLADPTITGVTSNGVTVSYDSANQTVTLNGMCTTNNTNFFFAVPPVQINAAHILSMYYASGSYALSGENSLWMAEASYQNAFGVLAFPDAGRSSSSVVNAARNYVYFALRLDAGSVFTNYTFRLQLEFGSTPSDWEPYAAQAYALIPDAPLYGWGSVQDHVGTDGLAAHYMERVSLTGDEAFDDGSDLGDVVRIGLALSVAGTAGETLAISSHFPQLYSYASNTVHFYVTGSILALFIPKSILSTGNLAGAKAWVKAQATAGTPIQVLYQRANPVYAAVAPVAITGMDGINTVTSDGASVTVSYTGSGWALVSGAARKVYASSNFTIDENGMVVRHVLLDGITPYEAYTRLYGGGLEIYETSTGKFIGGLTAKNGKVFLAASVLSDPRALNDHYWNIESVYNDAAEKYTCYLTLKKSTSGGEVEGLKIGGMIFDNESPKRTYANISVDSGTVVLGAGEFLEEDSMRFRVANDEIAIEAYRAGTNTVREAGFSNYGAGEDYFYFRNCDVLPASTSIQNFGSSGRLWKKLYAASGTIGTSDEREKHDIAPMDTAKALEFLMALTPVSYRLNLIPEELHYGFIAQAFKAAMDSVGIPEDFAGYDGSNADHLGLCYTELIAVLTIAVQQQQHEIEALKATVSDHTETITALQATVESQAAEIQALRDDRDAQAAEIQTLRADYDAQQAKINEFETRLGELEAKLA